MEFPISIPIDLEPVLEVEDLGQTLKYYTEKLGFVVDWIYGDPLDHASVSIGEQQGQNGHGSHGHIQLSHAGKPVNTAGWLYFHLRENIEQLYQIYKEKGVEFVSELAEMPWGMKEFTIKELNGHVFRFGQPLPHFNEEH